MALEAGGTKWSSAMKVQQAMRTGTPSAAPDTPLSTLAQLMQQHNIGAIPISENDSLVGMVTDRDIVCRGVAAGLDLGRATAQDIMSKGIFHCEETEEVAEAARTMQLNKVRRLPVINQDKRLVGFLSIGDISRTDDRLLCAEIVQAAVAPAA
jgi:CBS domain-containing protein